MWALRRASNPLNCPGFGPGTARACCSKLEISTSCAEDEAGILQSPQAVSDRSLSLLRFYCSSHASSKFSAGRRGISSQAGAKSSGEEDDLEKRCSELETPASSEAVRENIAEEDVFEEWHSELRRRLAKLNFRDPQNLSEWLEANKRLDFVERDYASHLDLIVRVHGLQQAESYVQRIPKSLRGEVIYRTLLANCFAVTNVKKAEEVFNGMKDLQFPIALIVYNQLLLLYKRIYIKKIRDVLLLMEKENVKPSLFTYKFLIDTKGQSKDITGIDQIVDQIINFYVFGYFFF